MGHVIGCDVGTQSVKAVVLTPEGELVSSAVSSYDLKHPRDGWSDQDPLAYVKALPIAINEAIARAGIRGSEVSHLALACQVDGLVVTDRRHRPLRDTITWLDRRAVEETRVLGSKVGKDRIFDLTGLNLDASHCAPKMMWVKDNEPGVYRQAGSLTSVGGFLVEWMTGQRVQDHGNASSTMLYDIRKRHWDDEMIDATGIDRALLPSVESSGTIAGQLLAEPAALLGLTTRCAVLTGTGDDHAATLGAGGIVDGVVVDSIGTAEPVSVSSTRAVVDASRLLETHAHAFDGPYLLQNPGFVSGGNTLWLAGNILRVPQADVFELALQSEPGARGVRFLPALSGTTTPRWSFQMRGAFLGLGMNHTDADLARAVIEANAFAFKHIYDRLTQLGLAESLRVVGGGSRSDMWTETKATICSTEIVHVSNAEPTAVAAAMLAGVSAGVFTDVEDAVARTVTLGHVVAPREEWRPALEGAFEEFTQMFNAVEPFYGEGEE